MAQFRYSAAIISRSAGQSVVAAAAYRAGEKLLDERTGDIKDYSRRGGVLNTLILTPENASQWMLDRQRLWNEVEHREDQSNRRNQAQLARSLELSLPHELTHEQHVELLRDYFKTEYIALGMIADIAIHAPPERGDGTNHHAHVLLTMRNITEGDGFGAKNRDWNQKALIELWRERWAEYQNRALEKYGFEARVDHRSLEDQGIDREPTTHLGPNAQALEDQGVATERGDENRRRKAANSNREQLKSELAKLNRRIAAVEKIQRIVAAVEKGYERFEHSTRPEPDPPSPKMETRRPQSYAHGPEAAPMPDSGSPADKILADAQAKEQERQDQARKQEEDRQEAARKEQDRLQQAFIADDKRLKELGQQFRDREIQLAEEFRKEQERLDALKTDPKRIDTHLRQLEETTEGHRQTFIGRDEKTYLEGDIRDPGARYAKALAQNYTLINPYESLAKTAMAEYASFRTDQETLASSIAKATDPKEREMLQTRKLIEGYDYLMITGERIAKMSEILSGELVDGRLESKESIRMREQMNGKDILDKNNKKIGFEDGYKQKAQKLREQYRDLQAGRTVPAKEQERTLSAADKILAEANRRTLAPSRSGQAGPNQYKDLGQKTQQETQEEKDRLKQQELERKAQKDRDRER